jgi:hypothetical protein
MHSMILVPICLLISIPVHLDVQPSKFSVLT